MMMMMMMMVMMMMMMVMMVMMMVMVMMMAMMMVVVVVVMVMIMYGKRGIVGIYFHKAHAHRLCDVCFLLIPICREVHVTDLPFDISA